MGEEFLTLDDFDLKGKSVLVRVDINSPIDPSSGRILNDSRIRSHIDTLQDLEKSKTVILAHQSRPGKADFTTLRAHTDRLSYLLGRRVGYVDSLFGSSAIEAIEKLRVGDAVVLENARMFSEEIVLQNQAMAKQSRSHIVQKLAPPVRPRCLRRGPQVAAHPGRVLRGPDDGRRKGDGAGARCAGPLHRRGSEAERRHPGWDKGG
jgi:phosphoglycerate kinase